MDEPRPSEVTVETKWLAVGAAPLGSECVALVVDAGKDAADWLGKLVVVPPLLPCGECDACRRALLTRCAAAVTIDGMRPPNNVPARFLYALPDGARPPEAATVLADALALPYAALTKAGVQPGDVLVVAGHDARAELTLRLGGYLGAASHRLDDGPPPSGYGRRLVATSPGVAAGLLASASDGDTLIVLGPGDPLLALAEPARRELTIYGQSTCHPDLLPELDALLLRGDIAVDDLFTTIVPAELNDFVANPPRSRLGLLSFS